MSIFLFQRKLMYILLDKLQKYKRGDKIEFNPKRKNAIKGPEKT